MYDEYGRYEIDGYDDLTAWEEQQVFLDDEGSDWGEPW